MRLFLSNIGIQQPVWRKKIPVATNPDRSIAEGIKHKNSCRRHGRLCAGARSLSPVASSAAIGAGRPRGGIAARCEDLPRGQRPGRKNSPIPLSDSSGFLHLGVCAQAALFPI